MLVRVVLEMRQSTVASGHSHGGGVQDTPYRELMATWSDPRVTINGAMDLRGSVISKDLEISGWKPKSLG